MKPNLVWIGTQTNLDQCRNKLDQGKNNSDWGRKNSDRGRKTFGLLQKNICLHSKQIFLQAKKRHVLPNGPTENVVVALSDTPTAPWGGTSSISEAETLSSMAMLKTV